MGVAVSTVRFSVSRAVGLSVRRTSIHFVDLNLCRSTEKAVAEAFSALQPGSRMSKPSTESTRRLIFWRPQRGVLCTYGVPTRERDETNNQQDKHQPIVVARWNWIPFGTRCRFTSRITAHSWCTNRGFSSLSQRHRKILLNPLGPRGTWAYSTPLSHLSICVTRTSLNVPKRKHKSPSRSR